MAKKAKAKARPAIRLPAKPRRLARKTPEADLQAACVHWFRLQYPQLLMWHIPNGEKRTKAAGNRLKKMGVLKGVPDLFLAYPTRFYSGLFVEMKIGYTTESAEQKSVMMLLGNAGYKVETVKTFERFQEVIRGYLGNSYK